MSDNARTINRAALVDLAVWAGGQQALYELGLPSEWNQTRWLAERTGVSLAGFCGTAGCLAGRTVLVEGFMPVLHDGADLNQMDVVDPSNGEVVRIARTAQDALGLTGCEATVLFHEDNGFDDVMRIVRALLGGWDLTDEPNFPVDCPDGCACGVRA